jgi:hypothetical protein
LNPVQVSGGPQTLASVLPHRGKTIFPKDIEYLIKFKNPDGTIIHGSWWREKSMSLEEDITRKADL